MDEDYRNCDAIILALGDLRITVAVERLFGILLGHDRLVKYGHNSTTKESAAQALGQMGASTSQGLIRALNDNDPETRRLAALALGYCPPDFFEKVIGPLAQALDDQAVQVHWQAAHAVCQIVRAAKVSPADLVALFRQAQWSLPSVLEQYGAEAVPHLVGLINHEEPNIRSAAASALGKIGPASRLRAIPCPPDQIAS